MAHRVQEDEFTPTLKLLRTKKTRRIWVVLQMGSSVYYLDPSEALDLANDLVDHAESVPRFQQRYREAFGTWETRVEATARDLEHPLPVPEHTQGHMQGHMASTEQHVRDW